METKKTKQDIRKKKYIYIFKIRVGEFWSSMSEEVVESLSLEI